MTADDRQFDSSGPLRLAAEGGREELTRTLAQVRDLLSNGGGGGTYGGMSDRITALETEFRYVRRDLDELKAGQTEIHRTLSDVSATLTKVAAQSAIDKAEVKAELAKLPTTNGLWGMIATVIGVALTMIGIVTAILALQPS